jgi:hypothetical protein
MMESFVALPDGLQHVFYVNEIPLDLERFIEKIYQSSFSVIKYFTIFKDVDSINALVISRGEADPVHVLAYTISGKEITLLNELVNIDQEYLEYFVATVFDRYPAITTVNFNRLKSRTADFHYPWRLWQKSQDIAVELPRSFDAYHAKLGRQTQKHIKYYLNRLHREQGDFTFQVAASHEIDPDSIARIIEMNRLRMKGKNIHSGYDSSFEMRITEFCRYYGKVSTVRIHGKIVAGAICYEVGNHAYLEAISHDPEFDKYNIGQVCLYLTIKSVIESGRDSFHMLWGENAYKYRFLGVKQDLYFLSVYRSNYSKLLSMPKLVRHTLFRAVKQVVYVTKKYLISRYR